MKTANIIAASIFIIFSLFAIVYTVLNLPAGAQGVPGPGIFPLLISGLMLLSAIVVLITQLKSDDKTVIEWLTDGNKRAYVTMVILVLYTQLIPIIGFNVVTAVFMTGLVKWFGKRKWLNSIIIAIAITASVYVVFSVILRVPLQFGILI